MKAWDINGFLVMLLPIVIVLLMGATAIIWIVMAQRTKRQAIAAGLSGEQYRALGGRSRLLQSGVLILAIGVAFGLIGLFDLDSGSALTWSLLLLAIGAGVITNHLLLRYPRDRKP